MDDIFIVNVLLKQYIFQYSATLRINKPVTVKKKKKKNEGYLFMA